jgi:Fe2+ or Zn2+ uptake regulation protein
VETLDLCVADGLERMARQMGYSNVTHILEIFGICPKCQRERAAQSA